MKLITLFITGILIFSIMGTLAVDAKSGSGSGSSGSGNSGSGSSGGGSGSSGSSGGISSGFDSPRDLIERGLTNISNQSSSGFDSQRDVIERGNLSSNQIQNSNSGFDSQRDIIERGALSNSTPSNLSQNSINNTPVQKVSWPIAVMKSFWVKVRSIFS